MPNEKQQLESQQRDTQERQDTQEQLRMKCLDLAYQARGGGHSVDILKDAFHYYNFITNGTIPIKLE